LESAAAPKKIGLIGLGLMGRPMGMNLIKAGYTLTVWNRTASRAEELVAAGAKLAKSPHEVAASSDFLLTMVSDQIVVRAVADWETDAIALRAEPLHRGELALPPWRYAVHEPNIRSAWDETLRPACRWPFTAHSSLRAARLGRD